MKCNGLQLALNIPEIFIKRFPKKYKKKHFNNILEYFEIFTKCKSNFKDWLKILLVYEDYLKSSWSWT